MNDPLSCRVRSAPRVREPDDAENGVRFQTKGQREAEIASAVVNYRRAHHGRGPDHARAFLLDDMVLIRQCGTLTPAENSLAHSADGWDLITQMHRKLTEINKLELTSVIEQLTGHRVTEYFSDTSRAGDCIDLFVLERPWNASPC
ncbi:MAG: DUF2294 domain-containing protein [Isosphaeraceae bacterium]